MRIRAQDNVERRSVVTILLADETPRSPARGGGMAFAIRITDASDPFFLYLLRLTEPNFIALKENQNLLVDYQSFPTFIRDLLQKCIVEAEKEAPKFHLCFTPPRQQFDGIAEIGELQFNETNVYKRIIHLSLEMKKANDDELKAYLAAGMKRFQLAFEEKSGAHDKLTDSYERTTRDNEQLQSEMNARLHAQNAELTARFRDEQTREREQHAERVNDLQARIEKDKQEIERKYSKRQWELEDRLKELEKRSQDQAQKVMSLESIAHERQTKIFTLQEQSETTTRELEVRTHAFMSVYTGESTTLSLSKKEGTHAKYSAKHASQRREIG